MNIVVFVVICIVVNPCCSRIATDLHESISGLQWLVLTNNDIEELVGLQFSGVSVCACVHICAYVCILILVVVYTVFALNIDSCVIG